MPVPNYNLGCNLLTPPRNESREFLLAMIQNSHEARNLRKSDVGILGIHKFLEMKEPGAELLIRSN